ncbi:hypothetical protein [Sorangium sp. So ce1335]|uniref:hypothetical protein n=1 Tax=Sorangium sp. So ce1335 TaxID=3133335 RepID=UPI003F63E8D2
MSDGIAAGMALVKAAGSTRGAPCVNRMCVVRETGVADTDVVVRAAPEFSTTGLFMALGDPVVD